MKAITRFVLLAVWLFGCVTLVTAQDEKSAIRQVLDQQVAAWNNGNIEQFMEGYWKSDSVQFIGSSMVTGWNQTLERYKKSYPNRDAMGTLRFELLRFQPLSKDAYLITGKYYLTRKSDAPSGIFTLVFRKIDGRWVIVADHTS